MTTTASHYGAEEEGPNFFAALPAILWQRRWLIVAPAVLALIAGVAAAFLIPPMYESSATVLIESQQLPQDPSDQAMTADEIDQRISRARERVLSRQILIQLIRANNLYPLEQQQGQPLSRIVDKMRDATTISSVTPDGANARAYQGKQTIALRIAYSYREPDKAQIIAQQFVNRFLEVDASAQADQAVGAANFLSEQGNDLQAKITGIEDQISRIKSENGALLAVQQQSTGNPMADASRIDADIAQLSSENARLAGQAATATVDPGIAAAQANLRALQGKFSDTHPDVIAAKQALDSARAAATGPVANGAIQSQIQSNRQQIASLQSARAMVMSEGNSSRTAMARAPAIQAQVDQLEKQAELYRDQYRQISQRMQSAQVSARMETEQKGERLTLADPPVVPDAPYKPNRPVLIVGALAAGLALGLGLVLLFELLLRPIRGAEALRMAVGSAPMVIIPDYGRKPNLVIRWLEKRSRRKEARA